MTNEDKKTKIPKKVSLSVTKGYEKEVVYFCGQPNKSQYIWNLVRKDMEQKSTDNQILEIVRQAMINMTMGGFPNTTLEKSERKMAMVEDDKRKKGVLSIFED